MRRTGRVVVASTAVAFGVAFGIIGGGVVSVLDGAPPAVVAGTGGGTSTPPPLPFGQHTGVGGVVESDPLDGSTL